MIEWVEVGLGLSVAQVGELRMFVAERPLGPWVWEIACKTAGTDGVEKYACIRRGKASTLAVGKSRAQAECLRYLIKHIAVLAGQQVQEEEG